MVLKMLCLSDTISRYPYYREYSLKQTGYFLFRLFCVNEVINAHVLVWHMISLLSYFATNVFSLAARGIIQKRRETTKMKVFNKLHQKCCLWHSPHWHQIVNQIDNIFDHSNSCDWHNKQLNKNFQKSPQNIFY